MSTLGIAIDAQSISVALTRRGKCVWAARSSYETLEELERTLGTLASERPRQATSAAVMLLEGAARLKEVDGLPPMRRADLASHVRLHSRRYFLQNGIPLVTDALPARATRGGAARPAVLAAAPAPLIDAILAGLEAANLPCRDIHPVASGDAVALAERAARGAGETLSLLPERSRRIHAAARRHSIRRSATLAAAAWLLVLVSWLGTTADRERRARQELEQRRALMLRAASVRADLDRTTEALVMLDLAQRTRSRTAAVLADVSRALPDSAFVASVRIDQSGITLSGYAPRIAPVAARLRRVEGWHALTTEGPVTREFIGGAERDRFTLRLAWSAP